MDAPLINYPMAVSIKQYKRIKMLQALFKIFIHAAKSCDFCNTLQICKSAETNHFCANYTKLDIHQYLLF